MNPLRTNARRVPALLRALLVAPCFALPVYWGFTYAGPYRRLAELQLRRSGSYDVMFTGLLVMLPLLLLALAVVQLLGLRFVRQASPPHRAARAARAAANEAWIRLHHGRLLGAMLGAGLTLTGLYFLDEGARAGPLHALDVAVLESGAAPPGRYVELTGIVRTGERVGVAESVNHGSTIQRFYLPVTSAGWARGRAARVYLETSDSVLSAHADELRAGRVRGMLSANALPGVAQSVLAARGVALPDRYWVLDYRRSPDDVVGMGKVLTTTGLVIAILTGAAWWLLGRRRVTLSARSPSGRNRALRAPPR